MRCKPKPITSFRKLFLACVFVLPAVSFLSAADCSSAADNPPQEEALFPKLKFPVPISPEHAAYLGLGGKKNSSFTLDQVKARVIILEVFSMYCPYCQSEAPAINGLYRSIAERGLADKIKLIGVGAGNSPYEVELFRKKYNVEFPLLPDNDLTLHQALGNVRTPYFIALGLNPDGTQRVLYSKVGTIGDPGQFLDVIVQRTGPL
jgi:peroxiredoxin